MGEPNVEKLQRSLTVSQMEAWMLYYKAEPWGYQHHEWMLARSRAQLINCTPRGKDAEAVSPVDLLPKPYQP